MDIDVVIAEAHASAEAQSQPAETKVEAQIDAEGKPEALEAPKADEAEVPTDEGEVKADEPFPKKAVNALSRKDKKIGKLSATVEYERQEKQQLLDKLAKYESGNQSVPAIDPAAPKPEDFKTWAEFQRAETEYLVDQRLAVNNKKAEATHKTQANIQVEEKRVSEIAAQTNEFIKHTPEYLQLAKDNQDFFENIPKELATALSETDNAPLALFALMKESSLDDLYDLPPVKLAVALAKAEARGESYLKQPKPTTNAPAPMTPSRGNSVGGKSLDRMDADELHAWVYGKK